MGTYVSWLLFHTLLVMVLDYCYNSYQECMISPADDPPVILYPAETYV